MLYPLLVGIGLAQAMTLYEPAFAVVARRYGTDVRRGIIALTLLGGFASTVFVPVIQFLLNQVDWRNTLVVLGIHQPPNLCCLVFRCNQFPMGCTSR